MIRPMISSGRSWIVVEEREGGVRRGSDGTGCVACGELTGQHQLSVGSQHLYNPLPVVHALPRSRPAPSSRLDPHRTCSPLNARLTSLDAWRAARRALCLLPFSIASSGRFGRRKERGGRREEGGGRRGATCFKSSVKFVVSKERLQTGSLTSFLSPTTTKDPAARRPTTRQDPPSHERIQWRP